MARHFILFTVLFHITMASVPTLNLNDGNKMPVLGLGTAGSNYGQSDKDKLRQAINWAVEAGYRHIDTAAIYDNEEQIGQGIADVIENGIVKREDLFVTTKLWNDKHARDQVVPALRESLRKLGLNYVDLYLIHFPTAEKADGSPSNIDYLDTWKGMEEAKKLGLAKSIGVSNFDDKQIDRLIANSNIKPAVNQVEVSPTNTQKQLVSHCQELGIAIMAYSPFGFLVNRQTSDSPVNLNYAPLEGIAKKYNKTNTQIILRYLIERGLVPIPKSTNRGRICENINIFDFQLNDDEIEVMDSYNLNKSVFP